MMGVSSIQARNFIVFSFVQLVDDFHSALSQAPAMSRSSTTAWLTIIESIPQTHTNLLRELHFRHAFDLYVKARTTNTLFQDNFFQDDQSVSITTPATVTPPRPSNPESRNLRAIARATLSILQLQPIPPRPLQIPTLSRHLLLCNPLRYATASSSPAQEAADSAQTSVNSNTASLPRAAPIIRH
jgi:hypothetical protein